MFFLLLPFDGLVFASQQTGRVYSQEKVKKYFDSTDKSGNLTNAANELRRNVEAAAENLAKLLRAEFAAERSKWKALERQSYWPNCPFLSAEGVVEFIYPKLREWIINATSHAVERQHIVTEADFPLMEQRARDDLRTTANLFEVKGAKTVSALVVNGANLKDKLKYFLDLIAKAKELKMEKGEVTEKELSFSFLIKLPDAQEYRCRGCKKRKDKTVGCYSSSDDRPDRRCKLLGIRFWLIIPFDRMDSDFSKTTMFPAICIEKQPDGCIPLEDENI